MKLAQPKRLAGISDKGGDMVDAYGAAGQDLGSAQASEQEGYSGADAAVNEAEQAYEKALLKLCRYIAKLEKLQPVRGKATFRKEKICL